MKRGRERESLEVGSCVGSCSLPKVCIAEALDGECNPKGAPSKLVDTLPLFLPLKFLSVTSKNTFFYVATGGHCEHPFHSPMGGTGHPQLAQKLLLSRPSRGTYEVSCADPPGHPCHRRHMARPGDTAIFGGKGSERMSFTRSPVPCHGWR